MKEDSSNLLAVGTVSRAHGIHGEFKVLPYSGHPEQLCAYEKFFFASVGYDVKGPYMVQHCRLQGRYALVDLDGIADRIAAQALSGNEVYVVKDDLPVTDANEFYLHELQGRQIDTTDGTCLGRVEGFLVAGGSELLVIKNKNGQEILVPAVPEYLRDVDKEIIRVELPPGFLDIYR